MPSPRCHLLASCSSLAVLRHHLPKLLQGPKDVVKKTLVCFFKNHNHGRRPVSVSDNPAHLLRPRLQDSLRFIVASLSVSLGSDTPTPSALGNTPPSKELLSALVSGAFSGCSIQEKLVDVLRCEPRSRHIAYYKTSSNHSCFIRPISFLPLHQAHTGQLSETILAYLYHL